MAKLFVDVGHSRVKYRVRGDGRWMNARSVEARLPLPDLRLDDEVAEVWIASVRSRKYNQALSAQLAEFCSCVPRFASREKILRACKTLYNKEQLGIDRMLAVLAAYQRIDDAAIVVDCGTALTIDAVDKDGCHLGGLIMPGAEALRRALADQAELSFKEGPPDHGCLARDTDGAVNQGRFFMLSAAARSAVKAMQKELGAEAALVLTGGDAGLLSWPEDLKVHFSPHLVLDGLHLCAQRETSG